MEPRIPWEALERVRHFRVTVTSAGSTPPVSHQGTGHIEVERPGPDSTLVWHQSGQWNAGPLAGLRFQNTTHWQSEYPGSRLRLSHLRRGPLAPVFLATLSPGANGIWQGESPHVCGKDLYLPILQVNSGLVSLIWEVHSPTDPYTLRLEAWD